MAEAFKSVWETVIDDCRGTFRIEYLCGRVPFLHLELRQWGPSILRAIRAELAKLKAELRTRGIRFMFVMIPEGDEKLLKFERLCGFAECKRSHGHVLLKQSTKE